ALAYYEKDLEITKELAAANPQSINLQHGLAVSLVKLGGIHKHRGSSSAGSYYRRAATIWEKLYQHTQLKKYQHYIDTVRAEMASSK
ncbi:hypothetical protein KAH55_12685, partial [bacterium]|nr:hypothetical protein [bacterium]